MGTTNVSRKFVDGLLSLRTKRIEMELVEYLCENCPDKYLKIVLFDFYLYCYIYQYGKFEYDSWHHKWDFVYVKQFYTRNKYGMEGAFMVKHHYVESKIKKMFHHFCDSLIERDVICKNEFEDFLHTASLSIAPQYHKFEGLSRDDILFKQGFEGIDNYLQSQYPNCDSLQKFTNHAYYKSYFNL